MDDRLEEFAGAAADFCAWSTSSPSGQVQEARAALQHLARLYQLALALREIPDVPEVDVASIDDAAWRSAYKRFGALPIGLYRSIFSPLSLTNSEPELEVGDLADDLADIYRDVSAGLAVFREGWFDSAEWKWAWSFRNHWGRHATGAIHALHCWFADEDVW